MKSSIADYFITQNGEREETSGGRSIKGSAGETQHFPFIFMETSRFPAAAATEVESGSTFALRRTRTRQQTTRRQSHTMGPVMLISWDSPPPHVAGFYCRQRGASSAGN